MSAFEVAQEHAIGNAATRLLVWLALNVDDRREPAIYFGGAAHRAAGMRPGISDRSVRECMAELKTAGVIEELVAAKPGRNASYRLMFSPKKWRKQNLPHSEAMAEEQPSDGGGTAAAMAEAQPPPERNGSPIEIEGGTLSPFCRKHPTGTDDPCWACKRAREARGPVSRFSQNLAEYQRLYGSTVATQPMVTVQPGSDCGVGWHKFVADGTCLNCDIRPTKELMP